MSPLVPERLAGSARIEFFPYSETGLRHAAAQVIRASAQAVLSAGYQLGAVGVSLSTRQNLSHRSDGATYTLGLSGALYASATDQVGRLTGQAQTA